MKHTTTRRRLLRSASLITLVLTMVFMLAVPAMAASTTLIKSKSITLKPGKSYTVLNSEKFNPTSTHA